MLWQHVRGEIMLLMWHALATRPRHVPIRNAKLPIDASKQWVDGRLDSSERWDIHSTFE